jgi:hypothetical protein
MGAHSIGRTTVRPADRRLRRAAVALGTATLVGIVGIPVADVGPSAVRAVTLTAAESDDTAADIAAVTWLKASYFAGVDAKDWAAVSALFAPDAVVDTRGSLGPIFYNRDSFIGFTRDTLASLSTHHEGYDPQITFTSGTAASVVWTMQDRLIFRDTIGVHGYGNYSDRYEKVGDTWIIKYSKLTRTGLKVVFPGLDHFVAEFGRRLSAGGPLAALAYAAYALAHIAAPFANPAPPAVPDTTAAALASSRVTNTEVATANTPTRSFTFAAATVTGAATTSPETAHNIDPQSSTGSAPGTQTDGAEDIGPSSPAAAAPSADPEVETGTGQDADSADGTERAGADVAFDGDADATLDANSDTDRTAATQGAPKQSAEADADAVPEKATASAADATPKTAAEPKTED